MGRFNAGKSTLATAIHRADGRRVVHLDRLHHLPGMRERVNRDMIRHIADPIGADRRRWAAMLPTLYLPPQALAAFYARERLRRV